MATEYLGPQIDIHGGGADLIFPHHACEIAQAEPVTGAPFVRYWMHTGMVMMDGTKMSKSLGNMAFVNDLLTISPPAAVRLMLLCYHYRAPFEYQRSELVAAADRLALVTQALTHIEQTQFVIDDIGVREKFFNALADDFNTPAAIAVLCEFAEQIVAQPASDSGTSSAGQTLDNLCAVLGLDIRAPTAL